MGPFTFQPGEEQDIVVAYVYARAGSGGPEASAQALKLRVDSIRAFAQTIPGLVPTPAQATPPSAASSSESAASGGATTGGVGAAPVAPPSSGGVSPGAPAQAVPPTPELPEGPDAIEAEPPSAATATATESDADTEDDSSSSAAGAIVVGLLAGGALFGLALLGRRGWMRWRYGL